MNILLSTRSCLPRHASPVHARCAWWDQPGLHLLGAAILFLVLFLFLHTDYIQPERRIGPTARVELADAGIPLLARVDTGASSTSLHACDIRIDDGWVSYSLMGDDGELHPMRSRFIKRLPVRSAAGETERVFVRLALRHQGRVKNVTANLTDRSSMSYPLLLGRDFLEGQYLVDVSSPALLPVAATPSCRLPSPNVGDSNPAGVSSTRPQSAAPLLP